MIPGTHKETAKLALANMCLNSASPAVRLDALRAVNDASAALRLADRRELRARYQLPASSAMPFAVALAVDLVGVVPSEGEPSDDTTQIYTGAWRVVTTAAVAVALSATATGGNEIWFREDGEAFISFEFEEDATLFRLAI